jgi:hypothetical protein
VNPLGRWAAPAAAGLIGYVVLFQWCIALGAPWGEFTQGGGTVGQLSSAGRLAAAASSLLLLTMGIGILARVGLGPMKAARPTVITTMSWLATGYLGLSVLLNLISPSSKERAAWAPLSAAIFVLALVAMLTTRRQDPTR